MFQPWGERTEEAMQKMVLCAPDQTEGMEPGSGGSITIVIREKTEAGGMVLVGDNTNKGGNLR